MRPWPVIDADTVIARLEEAGDTILSLPRSDATAMGPIQDSATLAIRIARMDQALGWMSLIPTDRRMLRRIVGCRCLVSPKTGQHVFGWHRLARLLGVDEAAVRGWHAAGIAIIADAIARDPEAARGWDGCRSGYRRSNATTARHRGDANRPTTLSPVRSPSKAWGNGL